MTEPLLYPKWSKVSWVLVFSWNLEEFRLKISLGNVQWFKGLYCDNSRKCIACNGDSHSFWNNCVKTSPLRWEKESCRLKNGFFPITHRKLLYNFLQPGEVFYLRKRKKLVFAKPPLCGRIIHRGASVWRIGGGVISKVIFAFSPNGAVFSTIERTNLPAVMWISVKVPRFLSHHNRGVVTLIASDIDIF